MTDDGICILSAVGMHINRSHSTGLLSEKDWHGAMKIIVQCAALLSDDPYIVNRATYAATWASKKIDELPE